MKVAKIDGCVPLKTNCLVCEPVGSEKIPLSLSAHQVGSPDETTDPAR